MLPSRSFAGPQPRHSGLSTKAQGTEKIRVAIAGAGLMGRWHADAARRAGADLVAVIDPDLGRAARIAGGRARTVADLDQLADADRPDILHVCTPTGTHARLIEHAALRGIHVFAEKPLAEDVRETRRLLGLADSAGIKLCPVHQYAFQRSIETLLRDRGRAGQPLLVELAFFSAGAAGRGLAELPHVAADILPHPLSILQRIFGGSLPGAAAWRAGAIAPGSYEMACTVGETAVRITISLAARPTCATLTLWGDGGAFVVDMFHDYTVFRQGHASRGSKITRPFGDALAHLRRASVNIAGRAIRGERAYPGLRALCGQVFAAVQGAGALPITPDQIIEVAELRDHFLRAFTARGQLE